MNQPLVPE